MINNRQGGRRRGRGGQRGQNLGGQPGNNRQDNRQRGNAAQLLEKYKSMARDSQLAGDRVQTEYFLQYADHYYRVLGENRPRFDEQRRPRSDEPDEDSDGGSSYNEAGYQHGDEQLAEGDDEAATEERQDRQERGAQRPDRSERGERYNRDQRPRREDREERAARDAPAQPEHLNGGETIPFDILPPAIGRDSGDEAESPAEERPKPRRRTRAARPASDEDEIAPAA